MGPDGARPGDRGISALLTDAPAHRRAGEGPRVLVVAPFERGASHGGSLRATAMAERLEARGAEIGWAVAPAEDGTRAEKVRSLLSGQPAVVRTHTARLPRVDGGWDAVIASHSYLAPVLDDLPAGVRGLVDFHNLEWRVLADTGRSEAGLHGFYLRGQAVLMRRFERQVLRSGAAVALASEDEHAWAQRCAVAGEALVVPNLLTRAAVAEARRAARLRRRCEAARLLYLGTLTFPPNVHALLRFLERCWPAVRATSPDAELLVAGRCTPAVAEAIGRHPGVRPLGFAEDLPALLGGATAALLPFEGRGGSSLRCLQYALARVPVVASPAAARGLPFTPGLVAGDPDGWARAVEDCVARAGEVQRIVDAAETGAQALQDDERPWDALLGALAGHEVAA